MAEVAKLDYKNWISKLEAPNSPDGAFVSEQELLDLIKDEVHADGVVNFAEYRAVNQLIDHYEKVEHSHKPHYDPNRGRHKVGTLWLKHAYGNSMSDMRVRLQASLIKKLFSGNVSAKRLPGTQLGFSVTSNKLTVRVSYTSRRDAIKGRVQIDAQYKGKDVELDRETGLAVLRLGNMILLDDVLADLSHADPKVQLRARVNLRHLAFEKSEAKDVVPRFAAALANKKIPAIARSVIASLQGQFLKLGVADALPSLVAALQSQDGLIAGEAARRLVSVVNSSQARHVRPLLAKPLADVLVRYLDGKTKFSSEDMWEWVIPALGNLGDPVAIPALTRAEQEGKGSLTRMRASFALEKLQPQTK